MQTRRMTMAQALVRFLTQQSVERDGEVWPFFAGCFGIFGHGNVAGIGQALQQTPEMRYIMVRNEQAMVHTAAAFAKMRDRLQTFACTTSIGPGATNMLTAAAGATINRLPVLLLPGDIFARRNVAPVLQQLESSATQDLSVNDCFRPISRYWDRIQRPEQLFTALPEAMRVLTSPAETGAVTLALPQDVQAEAFDVPEDFLRRRVWHVARPRPDRALLHEAARWIRASHRPLVVAGGGVLYSGAAERLDAFARATGIPVAETQAGKGSLRFDHPQSLGAMGVTGTAGAIAYALQADLVIGVGTRYSDFTTASKTAFQHPDVRFVNINVAELDAAKHSGLALSGDAREALAELQEALAGYHVGERVAAEVAAHKAHWESEVDRIYGLRHAPRLSQGEVIGVVNRLCGERDVVVCAAGSLPGDLHKLWRARDPKGYHLEYGYSCMGYEIAGGIGVKMAAPDREVVVMVGDASYLMMAQELVTAVQEGIKITVVLLDNHGYASIGALSESLGSHGFGTRYRMRAPDGTLTGEPIHVDYVANAASLGVEAVRLADLASFEQALSTALAGADSRVLVVETDREQRVPGYGAWWDVPIAEASEQASVREARARYDAQRARERSF